MMIYSIYQDVYQHFPSYVQQNYLVKFRHFFAAFLSWFSYW